MNLNLVVIRTNRLEELKIQYAALGLDFTYHKHGKGPYHYSADINELVFEIYPLSNNAAVPDTTTRLGFKVNELGNLVKSLELANWKIISTPSRSEWGIRAVIQDLDGRKVELSEMA